MEQPTSTTEGKDVGTAERLPAPCPTICYQDFPRGLCQCGCGERTTIAKHDDSAQGYKAGEPRRFVHGHWHRWKRKNERPDWGQPTREKCMKIATRVAQEVCEFKWDEAIGPAFEACVEYAMKRGIYVPDLEAVAREAIAKHFKSQVSYGHVSVDYLVEKGYEPAEDVS